MAAVNITTLSKKLDPLLAWGWGVVLVSEVRASLNTQKSIERRARRHGYTFEWSKPPPSAPTFEVAPGGVGIALREPNTMHKLFPPLLMKWHDEGRVVAVEAVFGTIRVTLISIYGYHRGHPMRQNNEKLLVDVFTFTAALRTPAIIGGDLNVTMSDSGPLALHATYGLWRLGDRTPSTVSKRGEQTHGEPIDHCLCNTLMLDLSPKMGVDLAWRLSDHFPLTGSFAVPRTQLFSWRWASKTPIHEQVASPPWEGLSGSYTEWCERARAWLGRAYGVVISQKNVASTSLYEPPKVRKDTWYQRACAVQRATSHIMQHQPSESQRRSLRRKLREMGIEEGMSPKEASDHVAALILEYVTTLQRDAIKGWKARVTKWTASSPELHAFLKNLRPSKACIVYRDGQPVAEGQGIFQAMTEYWSAIEQWPSPSDRDRAEAAIEEYMRGLPHEPMVIGLEARHILKAAKCASKRKATGLDGWSVGEIAALPRQAWNDLIMLLSHEEGAYDTLMTAYRRVPLLKGSPQRPTPADYRPVDIFSTITRVWSTAQARQLRPWLLRMLHEEQHAMRRGTICVAARTAIAIEGVVHMKKPTFGFVLDFAKLFNTICPSLASKVLQRFGLCEEDTRAIILPILKSRGYWRLPRNEVAAPVVH